MRFEVDKKVKAGLLFGLLALGLARPTARDHRDLTEVSTIPGLEARTFIKPVVPKIGVPNQSQVPI